MCVAISFSRVTAISTKNDLVLEHVHRFRWPKIDEASSSCWQLLPAQWSALSNAFSTETEPNECVRCNSVSLYIRLRLHVNVSMKRKTFRFQSINQHFCINIKVEI